MPYNEVISRQHTDALNDPRFIRFLEQNFNQEQIEVMADANTGYEDSVVYMWFAWIEAVNFEGGIGMPNKPSGEARSVELRKIIRETSKSLTGHRFEVARQFMHNAYQHLIVSK